MKATAALVLLLLIHASLGFRPNLQVPHTRAKLAYTNGEFFETDPPKVLESQALVEETGHFEETNAGTAASRHKSTRAKWGVDNKHEAEYWFDHRIHNLGNTGFTGALHAAVAPFSTKLIDMVAYDGVDLRHEVAKELSKFVKSAKPRVVDLCCGVGTSTRALARAFPKAGTVIGVDASKEMVAMAEFLNSHLSACMPIWDSIHSIGVSETFQKTVCSLPIEFRQSNAEDTKLPDKSFDLVTIMYAFHEAPRCGRERILKEAQRLLSPTGTLAVVDISCDYKPSPSMLSGEPYVLEYQQNIESQLSGIEGFAKRAHRVVVPGHVAMWVLQPSPQAA